MNKFQEYAVRSFIETLRPENVTDSRWDLLLSSIRTIAFDTHDEWMKKIVKMSHETLIEFGGQEFHDHVISEVERFKTQIWQDQPGSDVATTEQVNDSYVVDADGVDIEYGTTRTVYHLFSPWRSFKAGDTIWLEGQYDLQGHFESTGWWYYPPTNQLEPPPAEIVIDPPKKEEKPAPVNNAEDDDDGYW